MYQRLHPNYFGQFTGNMDICTAKDLIARVTLSRGYERHGLKEGLLRT